MKRILVTGGAGFIGSNFIQYWLKTYPNDKIVNLDALTYAGNPGNLMAVEDHENYRFVHGNICDSTLLPDLLESAAIDTVVNFAAESHVDRSIYGPEAFIKTNIFGTFTLLEAAKSVWAGDQSTCRFLHVSTDEVYGSLGPDDAPFSEQTPYAPNSPYSASKAGSDHLVRAYHHTYGMPVLTTNCSNNYGPFQFPEKLIPLVIISALEGREIPVYGDGTNIRDWLYVEDHCRGIERALLGGRSGETYNLGGCNEWKNIDIVNRICALLDEMVPGDAPRRELIRFVTDRPGHDLRYAIDADKAMRELGWQPRDQFESGIRKTIEWYLDNQGWLDDVRGGKHHSIAHGAAP